MEDDNNTYEIGKSIINILSCCKSQEEFDVADRMVTAICGYSIESLVKEIEKRDAEGFCWMSCDND